MSGKELRRAGVLARVEKDASNLVNAAAILALSYRQTKRLWRRYREEGAEGLRHRSVGRESGRKKSVSSESAAIGGPAIFGRGWGTIRADAGSRASGWRSTRFGERRLFWRLPALRPKRSAYGLAGLRFARRHT